MTARKEGSLSLVFREKQKTLYGAVPSEYLLPIKPFSKQFVFGNVLTTASGSRQPCKTIKSQGRRSLSSRVSGSVNPEYSAPAASDVLDFHLGASERARIGTEDSVRHVCMQALLSARATEITETACDNL